MRATSYLISTTLFAVCLFAASWASAATNEQSMQRASPQATYGNAAAPYRSRVILEEKPKVKLHFEEVRSLRSLERQDSRQDQWRRHNAYWPQDERKLHAPGHWNNPGQGRNPGFLNLPGRPRR